MAGWDKRSGGQVFCIPIGGTVVQEKWAADGSGSIFLLGYMDSVFRCSVGVEPSSIFLQLYHMAQRTDLPFAKGCHSNGPVV